MVRADSTKSAGYKSKIIRIMCGIAGVLSKFCKIGEDGNLATTEKMLDFLA